MDEFARAVVSGVGAGTLDALLAFGVVLIFRTTGVLNFAQAAIGTFAVYVAYAVAPGRPLWAPVAAGILAGALAGMATFGTVHGIRSRNYALTSAVATLAAAVLLRQVVAVFWENTSGQFPSPFPAFAGITLGNVFVSASTIGAAVTTLLLALAIGSFLRWTRTGMMVRALSDNPEAAQLCGGHAAVLVLGIWGVAGALAAIAGMWVAQLGLTPVFLEPFFIGALVAAVLGGLRSLTAALLGAVAIEVAWNLLVAYGSQYVPFELLSYSSTFVLLVLILTLLLVPRRWLAGSMERRV